MLQKRAALSKSSMTLLLLCKTNEGEKLGQKLGAGEPQLVMLHVESHSSCDQTCCLAEAYKNLSLMLLIIGCLFNAAIREPRSRDRKSVLLK